MRIPYLRAAVAMTLMAADGATGAAAAKACAFHLGAEKEQYLLGEPVYLRIEPGAAAVPAAPVPSLEEGTVVLGIKDADGPERIYHPPLRFRAAPGGTGTGDSAFGRMRFARLIASDGELVFREPGRYRLRLLSAPPRPAADALSDSLVLRFAAASLPADKRAYAILSRNPGDYGLAVYLEGGDQLRAGMAIMNELAGFANAYARTASFVLASDWSQDFTDYRGNASRPIDLQKALAWSQWDKTQGAYIPLRNAYRLRMGMETLAARQPSAPGIAAVRARLASFTAALTPQEAAWMRSFSLTFNPG